MWTEGVPLVQVTGVHSETGGNPHGATDPHDSASMRLRHPARTPQQLTEVTEVASPGRDRSGCSRPGLQDRPAGQPCPAPSSLGGSRRPPQPSSAQRPPAQQAAWSSSGQVAFHTNISQERTSFLHWPRAVLRTTTTTKHKAKQ